jgi:hypothetical protein
MLQCIITIYLLDIIHRFIFIANDVLETGLCRLPPAKSLLCWAQSKESDIYIWTSSIDWAPTIGFLIEDGENPFSETSFPIQTTVMNNVKKADRFILIFA